MINHLDVDSNRALHYLMNNYKNEIRKTTPNTNEKIIDFIYELIEQTPMLVQGISHNVSLTTDITEVLSSSFLTSSKFMTDHVVMYIRDNIEFSYKCVLKFMNFTFYINFNAMQQIDIKPYIAFVKVVLVICCKHIASTNPQEYFFDIFLTDLKKKLPENKMEEIGPDHVNSGFTELSENMKKVVIYRSEEWKKVFIHECFHLFCFDVHGYENEIRNMMSKMFNIESDFSLFETFVELWARVLNVGITTFYSKKKISRLDFHTMFNVNINMEKIWSYHQTNKILQHFGLKYEDLIKSKERSRSIISYKERSNVFQYYILTSLFMYNFDKVMHWMMHNNNNVLNFKKDERSLVVFLYFINEIYKSKKFIFILDVFDSHDNKSLRMGLF
jgi:hypothetical protein